MWRICGKETIQFITKACVYVKIYQHEAAVHHYMILKCDSHGVQVLVAAPIISTKTFEWPEIGLPTVLWCTAVTFLGKDGSQDVMS